jgi:hypothetical protein
VAVVGKVPVLLALTGLLLLACENPFAPPLGDPVSIWTDQESVGGLLENFRNAYVRQDSLRYAECLACPDYQFHYYDSELGEYDWMPRETDLQTTGRLFRHYSNIDLRWVGLPESLYEVDTPDSLVRVTVFFELRLGVEVITGSARFSMIKSQPVDDICQSPIFEDRDVFRIVQWDDDL